MKRQEIEAALAVCERDTTDDGQCHGIELQPGDWSGCGCDCPTCEHSRIMALRALRTLLRALPVVEAARGLVIYQETGGPTFDKWEEQFVVLEDAIREYDREEKP